MDAEDVGAITGCLVFIGLILIKVAVAALIVYVAWHFISKYW